MNDTEIAKFNKLYGEGGNLQKNLVILDGVTRGEIGFFGKRKLKKSIQVFQEALELYPSSWQSMFFIGKAFQALGDLDVALSWFLKVAKLESNNPSVAKEAGLCASQLRRHDEAINLMSGAASSHPQDAALQCNLGLSYLMSGQAENARTSFTLAALAEPENITTKKLLKLAGAVLDGKCAYPKSESEILNLL